jgi:hypothetical protein
MRMVRGSEGAQSHGSRPRGIVMPPGPRERGQTPSAWARFGHASRSRSRRRSGGQGKPRDSIENHEPSGWSGRPESNRSPATSGVMHRCGAAARSPGHKTVSRDERLRFPEGVPLQSNLPELASHSLLALIDDSRGPVRQMAGALGAAMCRIAGSQATASHGALAPRRPMHGSSRPKRVLVVTTVPGIADQG